MKLSDFNYNLPEELIAQYPLPKRENARLMVIHRACREIVCDYFSSLSRYLPRHSLLVLNNSKVIPARLLGKKEKSGGAVEIFLLRKLSDGISYEALLRPLRRIKENEAIVFNGNSLKAFLVDKKKRIVRFNTPHVERHLARIGHMPLPPYIKRKDEKLDRKFYQTVYAAKPGSVAAPTAGLHFTAKGLKELQKHGHHCVNVTLHINYATFEPVQAEDVISHRMHRESYEMPKRTYDIIKKAKANGQAVVAVGTTSCRVLETVAVTNRLKGDTDLFIYPGYTFQMVDCLLTNFHLPKSTLLMLVAAFASHDLIMEAYKKAIAEKFRFFSYGDCMLII